MSLITQGYLSNPQLLITQGYIAGVSVDPFSHVPPHFITVNAAEGRRISVGAGSGRKVAVSSGGGRTITVRGGGRS